MTTTTTRTVKEDLSYQVLRHQVNEKAYAEGRITGPQFIATRNKIRDRMEALHILVG